MSPTPTTSAGPPARADRAAPTTAAARPAAGSEPSREAKQRAAAILEVLAGARTPLQAAGALGVSLSRYYLLEAQALAGLLAACEQQPRGRSPDEGRRRQALERECQRWQRECAVSARPITLLVVFAAGCKRPQPTDLIGSAG